MGIERRPGQPIPHSEDWRGDESEAAKKSAAKKPEFAAPEIVHGEAKAELVRRFEKELAGKYDAWAARVTRAELIGKPEDKKETAAEAKAMVAEIIRLMEMEDPKGVGEALDKAGQAKAREYMKQLNDPKETGIKTMADVATDHLAGGRAKTLDERRILKYPGPKAFADLKRLLSKDLEALAGVHLAGPKLVPSPEKRRESKEERRERIDKAIEFLTTNDHVMEQYRQMRMNTLGHGIDESLPARKEFIRELIEDMIPENVYDENVREMNDELQKGVAALIEKGGGNPSQERAWRDLLLEASAEELRQEILKSRPGLKGGGQTGEETMRRVIEGLLKDMGDPVALKAKRKRPGQK